MAKRPTKAEEAEREQRAEADQNDAPEIVVDESGDDGDWNDAGGPIEGEASEEDRQSVNTEDPEPRDNGDDDTADTSGDDVLKVAVVPAPVEDQPYVAGEALTPGQLAGLEPMDRDEDNRQAEDREHRVNMQTDHERENALDPTSSDPNPGVTPNASYTAAATGAPPSDMSGRPAMSATDQEALTRARAAMTEARRADGADDTVEEDREGYRTPQQLGIAGGVMARLQSIYPDRIEYEEVPNGHHFPETGRRYRLK